MKVKVNSKKGFKTILSVLVDKKTIQKKLDEKLNELQNKVQLKGFRPGKVPTNIIKNQFGKAVYGEVIDGILKETSSTAITIFFELSDAIVFAISRRALAGFFECAS